MDNHTEDGFIGWVTGSNDRGTLDIIWSSTLAIFLCTWTAICLNLPHPEDTKFDMFCRRAKWMFWAIVGPELVLSVAIGQYACARRSVKRFQRHQMRKKTAQSEEQSSSRGSTSDEELSTRGQAVPDSGGEPHASERVPLSQNQLGAEGTSPNQGKKSDKKPPATWTLRHGFFADMGGMLLKPRNSTPFVINSRQLAYLVEKGYLDRPDITADEIWDKSKADTLARIVTLLQAVWVMIQLLGRAVLRLPTSTLELSTGAIVFCTFGTFICWLDKPSDVHRGIVLETGATTAEILHEAGDAAALPYRHTPLDFVAKESFTCGYDVMGFFGLRFDSQKRPLRRFPDDRFPDIGTLEKFVLFCVTTAFASFHLIGWNFAFPTRMELILWRVSSSIITGVTVFFWLFETIAARHRFGRWDPYLVWLGLKKEVRPLADLEAGGSRTRQDTIGRQDAFEKEQKKAKPILLWEIGLLLPLVLMYAVARGYMIVEAFIGLRSLPVGVYTTFSVADILPHL